MTPIQAGQMSQRIGAVLSEYADQYLLFVVPLDDPANGITVGKVSPARLAREDLEDQIIAHAMEIIHKRRARTGG